MCRPQATPWAVKWTSEESVGGESKSTRPTSMGDRLTAACAQEERGGGEATQNKHGNWQHGERISLRINEQVRDRGYLVERVVVE